MPEAKCDQIDDANTRPSDASGPETLGTSIEPIEILDRIIQLCACSRAALEGISGIARHCICCKPTVHRTIGERWRSIHASLAGGVCALAVTRRAVEDSTVGPRAFQR